MDMLFTGCEVRMRKTVPEVLKTAEPERRGRFEDRVHSGTEAAGK